MSDETRTVTVEDIERAIREIAPVVGGELQAGGIKHHVGLAHAIFAALPTSTEGLDVERLADALEAYVHSARSDPSPWARNSEDIAADIAAEYASLSPSPTEDPA